MGSNFNSDIQARILVIDDDPLMRLLMTDALSRHNYDIAEFDNGIDALEDIHACPPDMVLLDVKMPGMSGFDVCTQIHEKYDNYDIAIVMVTGLGDSESIEQAFKLGATAFISKPINPITFPYRIQYLLSARRAFIDLKEREIHLEYMDRISAILTNSNNLDIILQETLREMRAIFLADRTAILKSRSNHPYEMQLIGESTSNQCHSLAGRVNAFVEELAHNTFYRARNSEYPIVISHASSAQIATDKNDCISRQILIKALNLLDDQTWYITLQRCNKTPWTIMQQETFYRISIRLSSVIAHHMLLQRLHESESLLRQAQHIGKLGNWSINLRTGELIWSDEIYRIYGYDQGNCQPSLELLHQRVVTDDINRLNQFEHSAFYSGETASIEYRIQLPDKQIRWIHQQGLGRFDKKENLIEINGTIQDITERILKQEQELHKHKMDAVGQLTSGISHDFGNLMTIAKGNLELIDEAFLQRYQIDDSDREIIEDARSAIHDGVKLTRQLLNFSRKKSIAPEPLNVQQTIQNFSHLFKKTLGDTISLRIKIQKSLPDIFVDTAQFESSLLNAVINARDAMAKGGNLTIHAKQHQRLPAFIVMNAEQTLTDSYVCITIADTGCGMSADILKRATEPFFTTKKRDGTGLGLSMIYGFMRQSNGTLKIKSIPGKGSSIILFFPVENHIAVPSGQYPPADRHSTSSEPAITVLIVEDREAVRRFAVRCLKNLTPNILQAENASDAMDLLKQHKDINLLFSDILMPGEINGRELASWVETSYPDIKILLTTASERESKTNSSTIRKNFPLLPKPYSQQDLLDAVNNLLSTTDEHIE